MIKRMMRNLEDLLSAFYAWQLAKRGYRIFRQVTKSQWEEVPTKEKFAICKTDKSKN